MEGILSLSLILCDCLSNKIHLYKEGKERATILEIGYPPKILGEFKSIIEARFLAILPKSTLNNWHEIKISLPLPL